MSETLAGRSAHEIVVKHSRFLAQAAPVDSPGSALAFLDAVADRDATHNCWAYRVGSQYRFSDDDEPAGTAGRPILAAIDGQGLDQVVAVVTRWYGGIKLGAGGLVRAYGGSAAECLRRADRRALVVFAECAVSFAFDDTGVVHAAIAAHQADVLDEHFEAGGTRLAVRLPAARLDAFRIQLRDATRARARIDDLIGADGSNGRPVRVPRA